MASKSIKSKMRPAIVVQKRSWQMGMGLGSGRRHQIGLLDWVSFKKKFKRTSARSRIIRNDVTFFFSSLNLNGLPFGFADQTKIFKGFITFRIS